MGLFDILKNKAKEALNDIGEKVIHTTDKALETISGGRIDIWDDSSYSNNQQTQQTDTQTQQVINNYLNTLKQQGLYKGENLEQVKKTSSGGIISPKNAGATVYEVETNSGTKLVRVDYSTGEVQAYDYNKESNTVKQTSSSISGTLKKTYWEVNVPTGKKSLVEVPKNLASVANKDVRKTILESTQKSVRIPLAGNIKVDDAIGSIPFAGQIYRAYKTTQTTNKLGNILKQNPEVYYDVYRASKYLQKYQLGKLGKETAFHAAAIATSALAGEVMGSTLAGKAASQAGKLATLRVGTSLATAGAAENVLTDIAYDKLVLGRNPTGRELIVSAALGAASAGILGTVINRGLRAQSVKLSRIGESLLKERRSLGYTKEQMANKLGISLNEYVEIEKGLKLPNKKLINKILENTDIKIPEPKYHANKLLKASYLLDPYEWYGDVIGDEIKRGLRRGIRVRVPTITPTLTPTITSTVTPSPSPTITTTVTPTTTPTNTPTITPTITPTPSPTPTISPTPSPTVTPIITPSPSTTPSPSQTPSPTPTNTPNPTPTTTPTPTPTPTLTPIPLFFRKPLRKKIPLFGLMPIPPSGTFGGSTKAGRTKVAYYNELQAARIFLKKLWGI